MDTVVPGGTHLEACIQPQTQPPRTLAGRSQQPKNSTPGYECQRYDVTEKIPPQNQKSQLKKNNDTITNQQKFEKKESTTLEHRIPGQFFQTLPFFGISIFNQVSPTMSFQRRCRCAWPRCGSATEALLQWDSAPWGSGRCDQCDDFDVIVLKQKSRMSHELPKNKKNLWKIL